MAGIYSPDVKNYLVGRGFALFKQDGTSQFVHLGNCPKITYTTAVTTLPHFSVMAGTRVQDYSVILQKGGKLAVTMEERTMNNLLLFFLGSPIPHGSSAIEMAIYGQLAQISGAFRFIASNDVGPRWYFDLSRVLIAPTGGMEFIDETTWGNFVVQMEHVIDDSGQFGTMQLQPPVSAIAPQNVLPPFIVGSLSETTQPFAPTHGELLTCNVGGWIAMNSTTFQWSSGGSPVSGATQKTYTVQSGDIGKTIVCTVTGSNVNGTLTVPTPATLVCV